MKLTPKIQNLVKTANNLFYKYGIKRVTVEEICETAGVSKMTFYKYFSNKDALVEFIVDRLMDDFLKKFDEVFSRDESIEIRFQKWMKIKMDMSKSMSKEFYMDLMNYNQTIHENMIKQSQDTQAKVMGYIEDAKEKGEINSGLSTPFIGYMLDHMRVIVEDPTFSSMYSNLEDMTRDVANFFFYGMFGKNSEN